VGFRQANGIINHRMAFTNRRPMPCAIACTQALTGQYTATSDWSTLCRQTGSAPGDLAHRTDVRQRRCANCQSPGTRQSGLDRAVRCVTADSHSCRFQERRRSRFPPVCRMAVRRSRSPPGNLERQPLLGSMVSASRGETPNRCGSNRSTRFRIRPTTADPPWASGLGCTTRRYPTIGGTVADGVYAVHQELPERLGTVGGGESATQADDGNRLMPFSLHCFDLGSQPRCSSRARFTGRPGRLPTQVVPSSLIQTQSERLKRFRDFLAGPRNPAPSPVAALSRF